MMQAGEDWYLYPPVNLMNMLADGLAQAVEKAPQRRVLLFFRADDIGVPGRQFLRLLELGMAFEIPLALAMVPAWTTTARWEAIQKAAHRKADLWCWHQHGWRHANHEPFGKKQEFGPSRSEIDLQADLDKGRRRLKRILGSDFFPMFTPPWNRCDQRTLSHLKQKKYRAVSRFKDNLPPAPQGLSDHFVNVDLHTRKEHTSAQAWANLLTEFSRAFKSGYCGIMLHHQRMSPAAFTFLEQLFAFVLHSIHIRVVQMPHIATQRTTCATRLE